MNSTRFLFAMLAVSVSCQSCLPALAQSKDQADRINNYWNNLDKKYPNLNKTYQVGDMQRPGEIQQATRPIQETKPIEVPVGARAITAKVEPCHQRLTVGSDALFEFDKATLNQDALITLKALIPMITKLGAHPIKIEGHTDSKGADDYNQSLSERRAERVKNWLLENRIAPAAAVTCIGYGEKHPIAKNEKPDGTDFPEGRAHNRRVEIVVDTCSAIESVEAPATEEAAAPPSAPAENSSSAPANPSWFEPNGH